MTAQKILELIESVDPSDVAALDEIDARVWCFVNGHVFRGMPHRNYFIYSEECYYYYVPEDNGTTNYTRSRDALKAIRPSGVRNWSIGMNKRKQFGAAMEYAGSVTFYPPDDMPTEELAELHAIIQAIEYERTNNEQSK